MRFYQNWHISNEQQALGLMSGTDTTVVVVGGQQKSRERC
jgi:hypothetical protein